MDIESLYHLHFKEEQGKELTPTLFLQRNLKKPYHIDYIFGCRGFQNQLFKVTVGAPNKWLEISDHMPVVFEMKDSCQHALA